MAQKVVIDVEARFIDNLTDKVNRADKAVDDLGKKKPKVVVDAETDEANKDIDQTGKKLDDLGKKKPKPRISLEDEASKGLDKILDKTKDLADKVCSVAIKIRDNDTLAQLTKIDEKAKSIAGKTWTAAVKVKDMALAPLKTIEQKLFSIKTLAMGLVGGMAANKFVKQPVQDYANKEDLVTQFAVMLKGKSDKPNYEAAEQRISELTSFAGETPFTRDEIYQASRVLQTYTQGALATPDSTGGLRMIGDIAAATGQEYTRVANYMGRLYNEVGRGGKSLGEPLMMLREIGALSAEQEEKIKEIATGSGDIGEKWEKIAGQFKNTDGMMKEMSNQMNNLLLGVKSFFKNNLYMKLGEGITQSLKPFLIDFRKWRSDNADLIASWAEQVKDFAADASEKVLGVIRRTASRANKIMQSDEFQSADIFGKIGMLWEGAIKNPFADWWKSTVVPWWDDTAVPWLSEKAGALGTTIGAGLSSAVLTLLGADATGVASQGGEIARSFVQGFVDAFEGSKIADAFIDAIGNIWDAMPMWAKMLIGGIGIAKGAGAVANLAGGVAKFAGGASSIIAGETAMQGALSGGAASFAGYLGAGKTAGLAGGTLAGASGATMAGIGAGAALGGVVGGATAISGAYDLYRGFQDKDNTRKASGGMKLGGVAAGAATGAMLGSVVPVLGTAAGALIGAGVGGIGGLLGSNKIKKDAAENAKSLEELSTAAEDNSQASDVLAKKQEYLAQTLGDVKLSYSEIQDVASNFLARGMTENMAAFSSATVNANKSMLTLEGTAENLNKLNWKASVGFKFDENGQAEYTKAIEDYIASAEKVIEDKHYEFTAAVSMLIDPKGKNGKSIIDSGDEFYNSLQEELDATETKLTKQVKIALKDGVIDADEQKIIADLQGKIAEITEKVTNAENTAKMEALKIKFGGSAIDSESFAQLQEEIAAQIANSTASYDQALTTSITGLKLQLDEGAINQEEYDAQIAQLTEGYEANVGEIHANAESLQLEILGDAFDIDQDQLSAALHNSLSQGIQPMNWSAEQASSFLNLDQLSAEAATGIGTALQSVAETSQTLDVNATINPNLTVNPSKKFKGTAEDFGVNSEYSFPTSAAVDAEFDPAKFSGKKSDFGIKDDYNFSTNANVTVNWSYTNKGKKKIDPDGEGFRGGLFGGVRRFSDGGMVRGGSQLIEVAEEGSPEMIIPMSSQRRGRALKLWAQAGHMMKVPGFANGGLVGGNEDEGIRNHQSGGSGAAAGSSGVQVNVGGVTVEINVSGGGDQNIAQAIAEQGQEIAEQISGILADSLGAQFANTPTKGVA